VTVKIGMGYGVWVGRGIGHRGNKAVARARVECACHLEQ